MNTTSFATPLLLVSALFVSPFGHSASNTTTIQESSARNGTAGKSFDAAAINTILKTELDQIGAQNVRVATVNRVVSLDGWVQSPRVVEKVVSIARSVRGVAWVIYDLRVLSQRDG